MRFTEERASSTNGQAVDNRDGATGRRKRRDEARSSSRRPSSLIVVSNRQPYRHEFDESDPESADMSAEHANGSDEPKVDEEESKADEQKSGTGERGSKAGTGRARRSISVDEPAGGLTAGLDPVLQETGGTWIAWGDGDADRTVTDETDCIAVPPDDESYTLRRLWLPDELLEGYYYGFSNRVLWPLCHEFPDLIEVRPGDRECYRAVNRQFAEAVADHATEESVIWLQDYHLGFAPAMIRERIPDTATIAQFWHIPWPSPEVFDSSPVSQELLYGLLGNDLLGFHVDRYAELFLECVERLIPAANVDRERRVVSFRGTETRIVATPMGVDAAEHDRKARAVPDSQWESFRTDHDISPDTVIGLGVDRLDYSKGIPERLAAIERIFERRPAWRGAFTFVQKATPSRTDIPAYERLGEHVRSEIDRINRRFETDEWKPIVYTESYLSRETLCALYRRADVMVVTPLLDGMNLVAQEFVASNVDANGALVLSNRAGAHELLGQYTYTIDPTRPDQSAAVIETALTETPREQRRRMNAMRVRVFDADLDAWMSAQFDHIRRIHDATAAGGRDVNEQPSSI